MFGHSDSIKNNNPDPSMISDQPLMNNQSSMPSIVPAPTLPQPEPDVPPPDHSANPIATAQPLEPTQTEVDQPASELAVEPPKTDIPEPTDSSDLLDIKQKALEQLAPLVDRLDQDPEEKFHTTMMMIQANDNQKLLPEAYQAAQNITDEKKRAQALLDVINEVNYFTQKN